MHRYSTIWLAEFSFKSVSYSGGFLLYLGVMLDLKAGTECCSCSYPEEFNLSGPGFQMLRGSPL